MPEVETVSLLREGIAAARAGDKPRTRSLLRKVTATDSDNELAWLWLSNAAEDPREAVDCLRQVISINPQNEYATAALPDALVRAAVAAAKGKDREQARKWLVEATELSPKNEAAWLWRAGLAEDPRQALEFLQYVMALNPNNERAKQGIAHYRSLITPSWSCPLCLQKSQEAVPVCPSCRAYLTLDDPSVFDKAMNIERDVLENAARRLYAEHQADPASAVAAYYLGLTYLNLGYADEGLKAVQAAVQAKSADPKWHRGVTRLVKHRQSVIAMQAAEENRRSQREAARPIVMIVDDSPTIRKLVSVTLTKAGYRILESADGYQVADLVRRHGIPALFLLDVNMPGLDGFQLCKLLRQNLDTASVPIVFLTGKDGFINKLRGQWAGAAEYLTKPFDPQKLLAAVGKLAPIASSTGP